MHDRTWSVVYRPVYLLLPCLLTSMSVTSMSTVQCICFFHVYCPLRLLLPCLLTILSASTMSTVQMRRPEAPPPFSTSVRGLRIKKAKENATKYSQLENDILLWSSMGPHRITSGKGRAVDPHSFYADPDPEVFLNADPDPGPAYPN